MTKDKEYVHGLLTRRADFQKEREELMQTLKSGQERLQTLNGAIVGIDQLLVIEGVNPEPVDVSSDQTLADLLRILMSDKKYHTVEELAEAAKERGFGFGARSALRSVGFTLLGMGRGGKYVKTNDGHWKFVG